MDRIEITGLSVLLSPHPVTGTLRAWTGGSPPPEEFQLILRYRDEEYQADFASTSEGRHRIGFVGFDDTDPWVVRIQHHQPEWGGLMVQRIGPLPTLESIVLAALSAPFAMWENEQMSPRGRKRDRDAMNRKMPPELG